jgi:hypothetical protein
LYQGTAFKASEAAEGVALYQGTAFSRAASVLFRFAALAAEVRIARGTDFFSTFSSPKCVCRLKIKKSSRLKVKNHRRIKNRHVE